MLYPELIAVAKEFGHDFVFALIMFWFVKQQEHRHKDDIRKEAAAREALRVNFEDRLIKLHDRMNQLMVEVLGTLRDNAKVIARFMDGNA